MTNYHKFVFLGTVLSASGCRCSDDKLDKLNMNDVLHKLPHYFKANETQAIVDRSEAIDMSKVSHTIFNETIHRIKGIHAIATGYNESETENDEDLVINDTRTEIENLVRSKLLNKTRRHSLGLEGHPLAIWDVASDWITRQKILDCMLTLIYMARHQTNSMVRTLATRRDAPYRMAYLWSKLQILHGKVKVIYNRMLGKANVTNWEPKKKKKYLLKLHTKALKIHSQYNFYYFVISRMHHNLLDEMRNENK